MIGPGIALLGLGGAMFIVAELAESYHSRRFEEHVAQLNAHAREEDADAIQAELERFHNDRLVDWATAVLLPLYAAGILAIFVGLALTLRGI